MFSLKNRILLAFTTILILPFILLLFFSILINNIVIGGNTKELAIQTQNQYLNYVNMIINHVENINEQIISSEVTQEWLFLNNYENATYEQKYKANSDLKKYFSTICVNDTIINSIDIYYSDEIHLNEKKIEVDNFEYNNFPFYYDFKNTNKTWSDSYLRDNNASILSKVSDIVYLNNFKIMGILTINILSDSIQSPLNKISFDQKTFSTIIDKKGKSIFPEESSNENLKYKEIYDEVIEQNQENGEFTINIDDNYYLVFFSKANNKEWTVISIVDKNLFYFKLNTVNNILYALSLILLFFAVFAILKIADSISKPLTQVSFAMELTENGKFVESLEFVNKINTSSTREVKQFVKAYKKMVNKLNDLIENEYKMNIQKKELEYRTLIMQINPHFLSNTLEVISSLALQNRNKDVVNCVDSLSLLLKHSIRNEDDLITIEKEVENILNYTEIMKIRFGDSLIIDIDIDTKLYNEKIIKFILQPLIENSIKYCNSNLLKTIVKISIKEISNDLVIEVKDNGCGMPEDQINRVLEKGFGEGQADLLNKAGNKIGLRNVVSRLKIFYNNNVEIKIKSTINKGTVITIIIKRSQNVEDNNC